MNKELVDKLLDWIPFAIGIFIVALILSSCGIPGKNITNVVCRVGDKDVVYNDVYKARTSSSGTEIIVYSKGSEQRYTYSSSTNCLIERKYNESS